MGAAGGGAHSSHRASLMRSCSQGRVPLRAGSPGRSKVPHRQPCKPPQEPPQHQPSEAGRFPGHIATMHASAAQKRQATEWVEAPRGKASRSETDESEPPAPAQCPRPGLSPSAATSPTRRRQFAHSGQRPVQSWLGKETGPRRLAPMIGKVDWAAGQSGRPSRARPRRSRVGCRAMSRLRHATSWG